MKPFPLLLLLLAATLALFVDARPLRVPAKRGIGQRRNARQRLLHKQADSVLHDHPNHPFKQQFPGNSVLSNCTENFYTQYLDHFNFAEAPNGQTNYSERYFVCGGRNWSPNSTIFFYTGNEANVELYINMTGLMWENADDFDAIMVFAEHRYFGKSLPFGSNSKDLTNEYLIYLSSDQALADYATLLYHLKKSWNSWDSPVIGFGGSYGGMLCTWFRIKYPHFLDGCIAGSAPIVSFLGLDPPVNENFFAQIETYDCSAQGGATDNCKDNFRASWDIIFNLSMTQAGRDELQEIFRVCENITSIDEGYAVVDWVSGALGYMTMGSYPYESSYMLNGLGYLPPYPMRKGCDFLNKDFGSDYKSLLAGVRDAVGIFYNYTNKLTCFDLDQDGNNATTLDGDLWNYLYCTQLFMPFGQNGETDMFWYAPWNTSAAVAGCTEEYSYPPRVDMAAINYGGYQIGLPGAVSNIVFSNGELDPWRGAGIVNNLTDSLHAIIVPNAGHHIDLFFSNPNDTVEINNTRQFELNMIQQWIKQAQLARMR